MCTLAIPRRRRLLLSTALLLVVLFLAGLLPRLARWHQLDHAAQQAAAAPPALETTHPERAPRVVELPLPATTEPILTTPIYARTDGYLKTRFVDIGDHVTSGQLLAEIATPEVDQELDQARATLAESRANVVRLRADLDLARTTLKRYVAAGAATVSQQQIDERTSSVTVAQKTVDASEATVTANQANVDRLTELQGFQRVYAPFDGIVTRRMVDFGSLISAGSTQGTTQLFDLAQVDPLRVFVWVPQAFSPDVRVGQHASVTQRELPGRVFDGTVSRTAGALDRTSRTLLTEVLVPNPDGTLLSGAYVTVRFQLERSEPPLLVPATALLFDARGTRVAVVADDVLRYRDVQVGRDYGARIEILSGIAESDAIATRWPGLVADGAQVRASGAAAPGSS